MDSYELWRVRSRCFVQTDLATAYLVDGDHEHAAALGREALSTASKVSSGRTVSRICALQQQVRPLNYTRLAELDEDSTGFCVAPTTTRTSRHDQRRHRQGMVIEGPGGWGEFCPFPEYDDREAAGEQALAAGDAQADGGGGVHAPGNVVGVQVGGRHGVGVSALPDTRHGVAGDALLAARPVAPWQAQVQGSLSVWIYAGGRRCGKVAIGNDGAATTAGMMMAKTVSSADGRIWSVRRKIEWSTPATGDEFEHDVDGGSGAAVGILSVLFLFWALVLIWSPPQVHVPVWLWLIALVVVGFFPVRWYLRRPWTLVAETDGDLRPSSAEHWSGMVRGGARAREEIRVVIRSLRTTDPSTPAHADSPLQPVN